MDKPQEEQSGHLLTASHLMTFSGLTSATYVVTNALKTALGFDPRVTGFVVALACCLFMVRRFSRSEIGVAFINGCAVYLATSGGSSIVGTTFAPPDELPPPTTKPPKVNYHSRWPGEPQTKSWRALSPTAVPTRKTLLRDLAPRKPKPTPTASPEPKPEATRDQYLVEKSKEFIRPWFQTGYGDEPV